MNDPRSTPRLEHALERLNARIDWERRDRGDGRMKVSLAPIAALLERLGSPERRFLACHVAGTKGKGSTASLVAAAARHAGLRTGLYTSPHVEHWTERVRLDGAPIAPDLLAAALEEVLAVATDDATWFDCLTAAAFCVFAHQGVELAAIEVGLGGRLDSTNALPPGVAAVTNIDYEHTELLGDTREAIALEKGAIAKEGGVLVCGVGPVGDEARDAIERLAAERGARFVDAWAGERASLDARNLAVARAMLEALRTRDPRLDPDALDDPAVVAASRLPGRLEVRSYTGVSVVLDGAHVPSSLEAVLDELTARPEYALPPVVLLGSRPDKDVEGLVAALAGRVSHVIAPRWDERIASPEALCEACVFAGIDAEPTDDTRHALQRAADLAGTHGWILATGSLHFLGVVRPETRAVG